MNLPIQHLTTERLDNRLPLWYMVSKSTAKNAQSSIHPMASYRTGKTVLKNSYGATVVLPDGLHFSVQDLSVASAKSRFISWSIIGDSCMFYVMEYLEGNRK